MTSIPGLTFAKQFPNPAEPFRGLFVAEQVKATAGDVDWSVIAPVPWIPRMLAGPMGKPYVRGRGDFEGIPVLRPRYPVLPRRRLYTTVAPAMAWASGKAFRHLLNVHGPRFVHAHALYPSGAAAMRLARRIGIPLVVSVHGSDLYSNLIRPAWKASLIEVAASASAIVCVGQDLARDCVVELDADPARVVVIPDTYDSESFRYIEREASDDGTVRLVSVGRLVDVKGHADLVRAIGLLARDGFEVACRIIGSGPELERLRSLAVETGIRERVEFMGSLPGERIAREFADADLFVMPSHREGFGVALIEAMATGLPAVATRSGGPAEIVGPDDGLLVPPRDPVALAGAIRALAEALPSTDSAAIAARIRSRYGPDEVGKRLVQVYRSVLEQGEVRPVASFQERTSAG